MFSNLFSKLFSWFILGLVFCLNQISIYRYYFFFTCGNLTLSFWFVLFFRSDFFRNGFPNSLIVRSRSNFLCSQWKFFELYVRTCPGMFFLLRRTFFRFTILPLFRHIAWSPCDCSRLVLLFSRSALSEFEHQLLSKAIKNEQSQHKKLKSEIQTG